ncbi:MAG: spore cortex biosynthesis protein YabQ [Clostridia bacterium]|nr:spore cortex biosynthesis protein YabQ [Clostridia bacterium]
MWEISLKDQIESFLLSLPLGAAFGLIFFLVSAYNIAISASKTKVFITDILFFIFAAFITFCFLLLYSNGEVRGYILFGIALGFFTFKALFSKILTKATVALTRSVKRIFERIGKAFDLFFFKIAKAVEKTFKKVKKIEKRT